MTDRAPAGEFFELVYDELRRLAVVKLRGEAAGHSLDATALVHEAFLRLDGDGFGDRTRFFRAAGVAMERILVDRARARRASKRGGSGRRVPLADGAFSAQLDPDRDPDRLLDVSEALSRLAGEDPRAAEVARLRLFAGLTVDEAAGALGLPKTSAFREWSYARAWLAHALSGRG